MEVLNRLARELSTSRGAAATQSTGYTMAVPASNLNRFMLWIDAVGGYLVCLSDEIVIGQRAPGSPADIAIQADISRKHAKICRVSGGYLLEPVGGQAAVGGRQVIEPVVLSDGDEIQLAALKMRFRKPHVLSSSARLEITSGHRGEPHADAMILMAESCVLGPKWQNHIVCREWSSDVVLYRNMGQLFLRTAESIEINGQRQNCPARLDADARVLGDDFSFTLEAI